MGLDLVVGSTAAVHVGSTLITWISVGGRGLPTDRIRVVLRVVA